MNKKSVSIVGHEQLGIRVFKNGIQNSANLIDVIERVAGGSQSGQCLWQPAQVGLYTNDFDSRKCFDWKPTRKFAEEIKSKDKEFYDVFEILESSIKSCVADFCSPYGLGLGYMEVMNIIKYYEGQYFNPHTDDGATYISTVSSVAYLNDNYEGGGLYFDVFDIEIKPEAGDVIVFPSTFIYKHTAMEVKEGLKYSIVTMFDYNRHAFLKQTHRAKDECYTKI